MLKRWETALITIAAAIVLWACATTATSLDAQWVNPDYAGKRAIRNVMVMSAVRGSTNRRLFEDRMVAALAAAGVKAVQSYTLIPEDGPISEERLQRAVAQAGVTHAMVTRIINVSTQVNVSPGMVMGPAWGPGWGWSGGWGPGWGGFAGYYNTMWATTTTPPQITTTQNVHADTRVFDAQNAAVLWSAATTTATGYNSIPQLIDQFVQLIVGTMTKDGVI
ncbi:MAG: hypothetical protein WCA12_14195 [Burkholderiales bacterium]